MYNNTELLIQLVRMTTCVAYSKLKKIIGINANKTKHNIVAYNEIETCAALTLKDFSFQ